MSASNKNTNLNPTICGVSYAFLSDVVSVVPSNAFSKSVVFHSGKGWNQLYATPTRVDFEEPQKNTSAGKLFLQKITVPFPGDDDANLSDFENFENQQFIVSFTYSNGISKIIGSKFNPATFIRDFSIAKSGSIITFSCIAPIPALRLI